MPFPMVSDETYDQIVDDFFSGDCDERNERVFNMTTELFMTNPHIVEFIHREIASGVANKHGLEKDVYIDAGHCALIILHMAVCSADGVFVHEDVIEKVTNRFREQQKGFCDHLLSIKMRWHAQAVISFFCASYLVEGQDSDMKYIDIFSRMVYRMIEMSYKVPQE